MMGRCLPQVRQPTSYAQENSRFSRRVRALHNFVQCDYFHRTATRTRKARRFAPAGGYRGQDSVAGVRSLRAPGACAPSSARAAQLRRPHGLVSRTASRNGDAVSSLGRCPRAASSSSGFEGLIDVVIPNENLHLAAYSVTLHCGIKMSGAHRGPATEEAGLYHDHPMPQTLSKL